MNILILIVNVNGGSVIKTIDELNMGDFIKVVQTDGAVIERLNFSGKIISLSRTDGRLEVYTMEGVIGIGFEMDDIAIEISKLKQRPNGWDKFIKTGEGKNVFKIKSKPIETKKSRVFTLVSDNPRKKLSGLLSVAMKDIGGDKTILTNYINLAITKIRGV